MKNPTSASSDKARPLAPLAALLFLAVTTHAVLVGCGGKSQESNTSAPGTGTSQPAPATQATADSAGARGDPLVLGAKVYKDRCALCHGPEGKGDGPAAAGLNPKPRNHTDGTYMNSRTDDQLLQVIRGGKGAMPAWGSVLSEQEIQAVLKHVRSLAR